MHLNTYNKNVATVEALSHTKVFVQQKGKLAINVRNQIISQKSADQEKRYILWQQQQKQHNTLTLVLKMNIYLV